MEADPSSSDSSLTYERVVISSLNEPVQMWGDSASYQVSGFESTSCEIFYRSSLTNAPNNAVTTANTFSLTYEQVQLSSSNGQSVELWGNRDYSASGIEHTECSGGVLWRPSLMRGIRPGTAVGIDFGDPNVEHADVSVLVCMISCRVLTRIIDNLQSHICYEYKFEGHWPTSSPTEAPIESGAVEGVKLSDVLVSAVSLLDYACVLAFLH